jgi:hypothetical protein
MTIDHDNPATSADAVTLDCKAPANEIAAYKTLVNRLQEQCPIPSTEILTQLPLFLDRPTTAHLLFMHNLYSRIISVPGIIVEFGVRWGRNLTILANCRTLYEPLNTTRKIVGFDTFEGFPSISPKDGQSEATKVGGYNVPSGHESWLETVLLAHEQLGFRGNQQRFELVKGDLIETLPRYLKKHPETIIAMAYFDIDLYEPTKRALELIEPHLTKGSVVGFDELYLPDFPGETLALRDAWGLSRYRIQRDPRAPYPSKEFIVIE